MLRRLFAMLVYDAYLQRLFATLIYATYYQKQMIVLISLFFTLSCSENLPYYYILYNFTPFFGRGIDIIEIILIRGQNSTGCLSIFVGFGIAFFAHQYQQTDKV